MEHSHRHRQSQYSTMRVLAPIYYDQSGSPGVYATPILVAHSGHSQMHSLLQPLPVAHEMYQNRARGYSTVSVGKSRSMSVSSYHNQTVKSGKDHSVTSTNSQAIKSNWFTWKRKSDKQQQQQQQAEVCRLSTPTTVTNHISEYCPAAHHHQVCKQQQSTMVNRQHSSTAPKSSVPPSLAKLFQLEQSLSPSSSSSPGSSSSPASSSSPSLQQPVCVCKGFSESQFMAPNCFDAQPTIGKDHRQRSGHHQQNQQQQQSPITADSGSIKVSAAGSRLNRLFHKSGTVKSVSTGSLLHSEPGQSVTSSAASTDTLNGQAMHLSCPKNRRFATLSCKPNKSMEHLESRKSILECDINPYELLDDSECNHHKSRSRSVSSSSKSRFHASNSVRIAGQSVFSSFHDNEELNIVEIQHAGNFKTGDGPCSLPVGNFHSVLIEPEPDYDVDDDHQPDICKEIISKLPQRPKSKLSTQQSTDSRTRQQAPLPAIPTQNSLNTKKTNVTRPKACPPPPPQASSTVSSSSSSKKSNIPAPPPLPPANFLDDILALKDRKPSEMPGRIKVQRKPAQDRGSLVKASSQPEISFQNELKHKLNQGVKSILKKTESISKQNCIESETSETLAEVSSSFESKLQQFEKNDNKPKKSVHFRLRKSNQLSRSRSASHIITETIHEEDDEHCIYDDVATVTTLSSTSTAAAGTLNKDINGLISAVSCDDIAIISNCSTISLSTNDRSSVADSSSTTTASTKTTTIIKTITSISVDQDQSPEHDSQVQASEAGPEHLYDDSVNIISNYSDNKMPRKQHSSVSGTDLDSTGATVMLSNLSKVRGYKSALKTRNNTVVDSENVVIAGANHDVDENDDDDDDVVNVDEESNNEVNNDYNRNTYCTTRQYDLAGQDADDDDDDDEDFLDESLLQMNSDAKTNRLSNIRANKPLSRSALSTSCLAQTAAGISSSSASSSTLTSTTNTSSASEFGMKHRFNLNTSPTPPPIPARRLQTSTADDNRRQTPKSKRSYSSSNNTPLPSSTTSSQSGKGSFVSCSGGGGSVRSLLVKKLNKSLLNGNSLSGNSNLPSRFHSFNGKETTTSGGKMNIRHFFSNNDNESFHQKKAETDDSLDQKNAAEEHIYEELDTVLVDAKQHHSKFLSRLQRSSYKTSSSSSGTTTIVTNSIESSSTTIENDSGTSSFGDSLGGDSSLETFATQKNSNVKEKPKQNANNRRNRISNLSNSSTESSNTSSGVPSSLSDDVGEDSSDDMITNSSSSLGSMGADQTSSSASNSCYYDTCQNPSEILERRDSGVGTELKRSNKREALCFDCNMDIHDSKQESNDDSYYFNPYNQSFLCQKCEKLRNERKEIVTEIVDTEFKYGRDLKVILEEFAKPINAAGLLTAQQVDDIFLNLDELIDVNEHFSKRLQEAVDNAYEQEDEDLTSIRIGELFTECFLARISVFEEYCIRQASASLLLNQLEKDKELLRIFLKVSQMENPLLRRMNLRSFLVVPVQRVTKYPLLLARLHKVTSHHHPDREQIHDAQLKLESYLDTINQKTKGSIAETTSRLWRRISNLSSTSIRSKVNSVGDTAGVFDDFGFVRLKKTALEQLKWSKEESRFILTTRLSYMLDKSNGSDQNSSSVFSSLSQSPGTPSSDSFWSKTLKFSSACAVLVTLNNNCQHSSMSTASTSISGSSTSPSTSSATATANTQQQPQQSNNNDSSMNSNSEPNSLTCLPDCGDDSLGSFNRHTKSAVKYAGQQQQFNKLSQNHSQQQHHHHSSSLSSISDAVLLLYKEKNGRYLPCRENINLAMSVITTFSNESESTPDGEDIIEISEIESRDTIILKFDNGDEMRQWLEQLRAITSQLGNWRRRRNALPNIMALRNLLDLVDNNQQF